MTATDPPAEVIVWAGETDAVLQPEIDNTTRQEMIKMLILPNGIARRALDILAGT